MQVDVQVDAFLGMFGKELTDAGFDDLNTAAIRADEYRAVATLAVVAFHRHEPLPWATPLQRAATRAAIRACCNHMLNEMRARVV